MNCKNQDGSLSERKRKDGSLNERKRLARVDAAKNIVRGRKVLMLGHLMQLLATNDQNTLLLQYYIEIRKYYPTNLRYAYVVCFPPRIRLLDPITRIPHFHVVVDAGPRSLPHPSLGSTVY